MDKKEFIEKTADTLLSRMEEFYREMVKIASQHEEESDEEDDDEETSNDDDSELEEDFAKIHMTCVLETHMIDLLTLLNEWHRWGDRTTRLEKRIELTISKINRIKGKSVFLKTQAQKVFPLLYEESVKNEMASSSLPRNRFSKENPYCFNCIFNKGNASWKELHQVGKKTHYDYLMELIKETKAKLDFPQNSE